MKNTPSPLRRDRPSTPLSIPTSVGSLACMAGSVKPRPTAILRRLGRVSALTKSRQRWAASGDEPTGTWPNMSSWRYCWATSSEGRSKPSPANGRSRCARACARAGRTAIGLLRALALAAADAAGSRLFGTTSMRPSVKRAQTLPMRLETPTRSSPGSDFIAFASATLSKLAPPAARLATLLRTESSVAARCCALTAAPGLPPAGTPPPPRSPAPPPPPPPLRRHHHHRHHRNRRRRPACWRTAAPCPDRPRQGTDGVVLGSCSSTTSSVPQRAGARLS